MHRAIKKPIRREPGIYGKILPDHRKDGSSVAVGGTGNLAPPSAASEIQTKNHRRTPPVSISSHYKARFSTRF